MDKTQQAPAERPFSWLPQYMPGVASLMKDKKAELGAAWVNECWKRGVLNCEPGWFFASEGALSVGVMWDDPVLFAYACQRKSATQALVILKDPPAAGQAAGS